jgi:hypothetical protein
MVATFARNLSPISADGGASVFAFSDEPALSLRQSADNRARQNNVIYQIETKLKKALDAYEAEVIQKECELDAISLSHLMAEILSAMKRLEGLAIQDDSLREEYNSLVNLRDTLSQSSDDKFSFVAGYIKIREALILVWYREWLSLLEDSYRCFSALEAFMSSIDELINEIEEEASTLEFSSSKELVNDCAANIFSEFEIFEEVFLQCKTRVFTNLSNQ